MRQQVVSVETLFPLLEDGGTYLVEDCHTSYWPEFADQGSEGTTFIEWVKLRVDDLNAYHFSRVEHLEAPWQTDLDGLHIYDSVVVLNKNRRLAPFGELSGTKEFVNTGRANGIVQLELLATRDAAIAKAAELTDSTAAIRAQAESEAESLRDELRPLRGELADVRGELAQVSSDTARLREEHGQTCTDLLGAWEIIRDMRQSRSWKMTAPIRRLKSTISRR